MAISYITLTVVIIASTILIRKYREYSWGKCESKKSLKNKTVVITGANSGIGKATAKEMAKRGAKVIMACRDVNKGQKALQDIRQVTKNGELKILPLDLASFSSIKKFARDFLTTEDRLDILVNNAGIYQCPFMLTEEGFEMQFGVNHLGHFLLTKLLMDKIKQSAPSRVIVVTSALYKKGEIDLDHVNSSSHYDEKKAYCNSKLANVLFCQELSKRLKGTQVNVYAVSPGIVWTNLGRYIKAKLFKMIMLAPIALFFVRTPYEGCQTVLHCALSDEVENESGMYYRNCKRNNLESVAQNENVAKLLWDFSEASIREKNIN